MIKDLLKPLIPQGQRNRIARLRVRVRQPTGPLRGLPDFLVVGAMRAGTSSLYRYLGAHPNTAPSIRKESEFFSLRYGSGESWYRAHFPLRSVLRRAGRRAGSPILCFEATPYYLIHPHAPRRAASLLPEARIVVLLRDPVERAFSHHRHLARLGLEPLGFEAAIGREEERTAAEWRRMLDDPRYNSRSHHLFSYLARGVYRPQLERWQKHYPREQMIVLVWEELFQNLETGYRKLLLSLGLPDRLPGEFHNYSYWRTGAREQRSEMSDATRRRLSEYFAPANRELYELVGRELPWS